MSSGSRLKEWEIHATAMPSAEIAGDSLRVRTHRVGPARAVGAADQDRRVRDAVAHEDVALRLAVVRVQVGRGRREGDEAAVGRDRWCDRRIVRRTRAPAPRTTDQLGATGRPVANVDRVLRAYRRRRGAGWSPPTRRRRSGRRPRPRAAMESPLPTWSATAAVSSALLSSVVSYCAAPASATAKPHSAAPRNTMDLRNPLLEANASMRHHPDRSPTGSTRNHQRVRVTGTVSALRQSLRSEAEHVGLERARRPTVVDRVHVR